MKRKGSLAISIEMNKSDFATIKARKIMLDVMIDGRNTMVYKNLVELDKY